MFNETNYASANALHPMFETVRVQFDWPQVFRTSELRSNDPAGEQAFSLRGIAYPHERAIQALRDVRHLLPPEGVAIVDAVLDCAT
ncbi:MAG: hypothetical protein ACLPX1_14125 [Steroidobacteraceae bacterium]